MTCRLLLIRHARSVANDTGRFSGWIDVDLAPDGYWQAKRLRCALAGEPLDAIYTSPLRRALLTAIEIAGPHGLTPIEEPDLRECYHGLAEGLTWDEFTIAYPEWAHRLRTHDFAEPLEQVWPEGETRTQLLVRSKRALDGVVSRHPDSTVAVVAHANILTHALIALTSSPQSRLVDPRLKNASVTELLIGECCREIVRLGDVSHL